MSEGKSAVFLSYASQDSDAARRIADALRAEEVEVWFDESELRGGEAWDASIQRQISECALFVAIVSAHTQARREGYFRLEWRLADERMRLMAEGTPFLLPVIVDTTKERDALVPKSFLGVQWTWLPHGEVPPAFVARVLKLVGGPGLPAEAMAKVEPASARPATVAADVERTELATGRRVAWMRLFPWFGMAVLAGAMIWTNTRHAPPVSPKAGGPTLPVTHTVISLPPNAPLVSTRLIYGPAIALSPDGTQLVYVAAAGGTTQLYRRPMDRPEVLPIPETQDARYPFFSPDGRWVGFLAKDKLKKVSILGGTPMTLCDPGKEVTGICWGDDGVIYFSDYPRAFRVPDQGGIREPVLGAQGHQAMWVRTPEILPGARAIIGSFECPGRTSGDSSPISVFSFAAKTKSVIVDRGYHPRVLPSGYLVFARGRGLHALAFDAKRLAAMGEAVPLIDGVLLDAFDMAAHYAVSSNGTLVYAAGGALHRTTPAWVRPNGIPEKLPMESRVYGELALSADGQRLAILLPDVQDTLWVFDTKTGEGAPVKEPGPHGSPVWSADGKRLFFASWRGARCGIYAQYFVGSENSAERVYEAENAEMILQPQTCSPDSTKLLVVARSLGTEGKRKSFALFLDGSRRTEPLALPDDAIFIQLSPDGRWLTFTSGESGYSVVYVQPFPRGRQHQVSFRGGSESRWSARGDKLHFRTIDSWYSVPITYTPEFRTGEPRKLFSGLFYDVPGYSHDVAPDGERFLVLMPEQPERSVSQLQVITNWTEELKRKVPVGGGKAR